MNSKDLRKFTRQELLELLVQQRQQFDALQEKSAELEAELKNRSLRMDDAGTMAEAALGLNQVFENADRAAAEYLENIRQRSAEMDDICGQKLAAAEAQAQEILDDAQRTAKEILALAEDEKQKKMKEIDAYWDGLKTRLEDFYRSHSGLKELLENSKDSGAQQTENE